MRVHLVGIKPSRGSQSLFLLQEADSTCELDETNLAPFLTLKQAVEAEAPTEEEKDSAPEKGADPEASDMDVLAGIALDVAGKVPTGDLEALIESIEKSGRTPSEFDSQLLGKSKTKLGALLDSKQKAEIRRQFLNACKARVS